MSALVASISCLCISIIWRCSARIWFPLPGPGGACAGLSCAHITSVRANIRTSRKLLIFIATLLSGNIGHGEYRPEAWSGLQPLSRRASAEGCSSRSLPGVARLQLARYALGWVLSLGQLPAYLLPSATLSESQRLRARRDSRRAERLS